MKFSSILSNHALFSSSELKYPRGFRNLRMNSVWMKRSLKETFHEYANIIHVTRNVLKFHLTLNMLALNIPDYRLNIL